MGSVLHRNRPIRTLVHQAFRRLAHACRQASRSSQQIELLEPRSLLSAFGPLGAEFRVNSEMLYSQFSPAIAMDPDGDFVVAWTSTYQDGDGTGVFAQRFSAAGAPQGLEFKVNDYTRGDQGLPAVGVDAAGNFVVAWKGLGPNGDQVRARRYNASGEPQGEELAVSPVYPELGGYVQSPPALSMGRDGGFVVVWQAGNGSGNSICAQRFDPLGVKQGGMFQVNSTSGSHLEPSVALGSTGNFVVAWHRPMLNRTGYGIYARRFNAAGEALGEEFLAHSTAEGGISADIAMDNAGGFLLAWTNKEQDFDGDIFARRYDAFGVPQGPAFLVNSTTTYSQSYARVTISAEGTAIITWQSNWNSVTDRDIAARRIAVDGTPLGSEFQVNTYTAGQQFGAVVATNNAANVVFAWASDGQGGSDRGVYAQRYAVSSDPALIGGTVWVDSNANGQREADESGQDSVPVTLFHVATGLPLATTTTAQGGVYQFEALPAEEYFVAFTLPTGRFWTDPNLAPDDLDSDVDPATGYTARISLLSGQSNTTIDAGLLMPASVSGTVFFDLDGNGTQDPGEAGLSGWSVFWDIDDDGLWRPGEPAVQSKTGGLYTLSNLRPLSPILRAWTTGWTSPRQAPALLPGETRSNVHFASRPLTPVAGAVPAGPEFRVNTYTEGDQKIASSTMDASRAVAMDANGNFVVVWQSFGQPDGSAGGVYGQRYNAAGEPLGIEFRVGMGVCPEIAMDPDGDFVVVWQWQPGLDAGDIYARRYDAAGVPQGSEFRVHAAPDGKQWYPAVAMHSDGSFVVAWTHEGQGSLLKGIYAQRFDASGQPQGTVFRVNGSGVQRDSAITIQPNGDFVIVWDGQDAESGGILGQRFTATGEKIGDPFQVNTFTASLQEDPTIATDGSGGFVVAWESLPQDMYGNGVYAQRFDANGQPVGGEFRVNTIIWGSQSSPSVAVDAGGSFVIAWHSDLQDGTGVRNIFARRYNAAGLPAGTEFRVTNSMVPSDQMFPQVAMDPDGDFVIVWQNALQDGTRLNIFAQRLAPARLPAPQITGSTGQDTFYLLRVGDEVWVLPGTSPTSAPTAAFPLDGLTSLTLSALAGNDTLTIDYSHGDPIPPGGLFFDGGEGANAITILGAAPDTHLRIHNGPAAIPGAITYSTPDALGLSIPSATPMALASLTLTGPARLTLPAGKTLRLNQLSLGPEATLDLTDGALILASGQPDALESLRPLLRSAFNDGAWTGPGLSSSLAAANPARGLAALLNDRGNQTPFYTSFANAPVGTGDILIKATLAGDIDLNGRIDATDYFRVGRGMARASAGYANGDFNHDTAIDLADYALIDRAFLAQSPASQPPQPLPALVSAKPARKKSPARPASTPIKLPPKKHIRKTARDR